MLNKYPIWKYLLIALVLTFSVIYALPNLYPPDPAIQISSSNSGDKVSEAGLKRAISALKKADIEYFAEEINKKGSALIRLKDKEKQLDAKAAIQRVMGDDFIVALNLAATTPQWLVDMGAGPMTLGLDLSGGVHFLMEVDMEKFITQKRENYTDELKRVLREEKIRFRRIEILDDNRLQLTFKKEEIRDEALSYISSNYREFLRDTSEEGDKFFLQLKLTDQKVKEFEDYALKQNLTTLRNRVNELGVAEPLVQRQGRNRIVIELPGVQDTAQAKKILGKAANLEFRLEAKPGAASSTTEMFDFRQEGRRPAKIEKQIIITGDSVTNALPAFDENGQPQVSIDLDNAGGSIMGKVTRKAIKRRMAVLFIEHKSKTSYRTVDGVETPVIKKTVEKSIISLATIQSQLGSSFRITGLEAAEASELALLLRAGALAAPMYFVEERTVGPSLGQENIDLGVKSVQLGMLMVLIIMIVVYRLFGIFANIALAANMIILMALMSIMGATLTLPGIAGIVLTVGMAVDANVLIFARIREELKNGLTPQQAIHSGYERAFVTIFDANLTTLIVAIILFAVGTGPVKGFAVTLSLGILTSMFTAIVLTRGLSNLAYGGRNVESLAIGGSK